MKTFYGEECINNGIKFILNYDFSSFKKIDIYEHNAGNFDILLIMRKRNKMK